MASLVNPFAMIIFVLFCGVTIPKPDMPKFWRSWLYELNPFTRLISGMVVTELHDLKVRCKSVELYSFNAPAGQTCGEYMERFFTGGGAGYIIDNATALCQYCAYKVGDQFYEPLEFAFNHRWRNFGIFTAFIGSNLILLFLGVSSWQSYIHCIMLTVPQSRYLNFNRR